MLGQKPPNTCLRKIAALCVKRIMNSIAKNISASLLALFVAGFTFWVIDRTYLFSNVLSKFSEDPNIWFSLYFGLFTILSTLILLIFNKVFKPEKYKYALLFGIAGIAWHATQYNFGYLGFYIGILGNGFYAIGAALFLLLAKTHNKNSQQENLRCRR